MKCVILVEDNKDNADLISDILGEQYHVIHFSSADQLLEGIQGKILPLPDLFILDISLPGMDGIDLLKTLRQEERHRGVPAVALTAHALPQDRERCLAAGFDSYISKPIVDEEVLLQTVSGLLQE